ncbi:hypothetical protein D6C86_04353 [Aureobasidium pullulans]|nr:hypothetical protein D6D24_03852 [Aureobasidium pullulans]THW35697.1 hypothetical protein D6D25_05169 [Aureobasidium pullulans]THW97143.1 hypothetical protein D6D15_00444 [Aureobasidium pullulans]THX03978.1 hypothetical protein D6D18_03618 [Aureobasidium pullulans]THX33499.1 hypothetical protein D6D10_07817 [Aureobasidium pullulans]
MFQSLKDRSSFGGYIRFALRILQFILAITVIGLYGYDLDNARKARVAADPKWTFAVVVGALSALSVFIYLFKFSLRFFWDAIMLILWAIVFGIFGKLFINSHPTPRQGGQIRMKNAVWIDLANMILWFITFVWNLILHFTRMDKMTLHTGRATV